MKVLKRRRLDDVQATASSKMENFNLQEALPEKVSKYEMDILSHALQIGDSQTVQNIVGLSRRRATRIILKFREWQKGCKIREAFCTPDARALSKKMFALLGQYALTPVGRDSLTLLTPSLSMKEVQNRFDKLRDILEMFGNLENRLFKEVATVLKEARFAKTEYYKPLLVLVLDEAQRSLILDKFGKYVRVEIADSNSKVRERTQKEAHLLTTHQIKGEHSLSVVDLKADIAEFCPETIINYYKERLPILQCYLKLSDILGNKFQFSQMSQLHQSLRKVITLLEGSKEPSYDLNDLLLETEEKVNNVIKRLRSRGGGPEEFREFIEDQLLILEDTLNLIEEEVTLLREAAYEVQSLPFTFSSSKIKILRDRIKTRKAKEKYIYIRNQAVELEKNRHNVDIAVGKVFEIDVFLGIARFAQDYGLTIPHVNEGKGIGFESGRNLFIVQDQLKGFGDVETVSYSVGVANIELFGAETKHTVLLTGANSGGKTTILETLALIHILTLLGLPVPAKKADVAIVPIYLFKRRTTRKVGSLEYAIKVLKPVISKRSPKLLLMDEFEALTEPGALGRIIASLLNNIPKGSLTLMVTHLAREILPYLRTPVRVDGIEARGIAEDGNLIVDRQPVFIHLGTSTPELIIGKLAKQTRNKRLQFVYKNMIELLESRTVPATAMI